MFFGSRESVEYAFQGRAKIVLAQGEHAVLQHERAGLAAVELDVEKLPANDVRARHDLFAPQILCLSSPSDS